MNNLNIPEFLEAVASDSPVPGGGSVSALCGALGSALAAMVCRLTQGRKKYAEHQEHIDEIIRQMLPIIDTLTQTISLDSEAYARVMNAYRLPKDTEAEQQARRAAIEAASMAAATVPMCVAETALKAMRIAEPLARIGNQNAITDVGVAMMSLHTAVLGACLNVRINLGATGDEAAETDLRARCTEAVARATELRDNVYNLIIAKL